MLLVLALTLWLLIALPTGLLLSRYGYGDELEVPFVLIHAKGVARVLWFAPAIYLLATLFLVFAFWRQSGWLWGAGSFTVASVVFSRAHGSAWKRTFGEIYARHISKMSHRVQKGDTLASLASLYGIAVEDIAGANGLVPEARLHPGTDLVILGKTPEAALQLARTIISTRHFWPPGR